MFAGRLVAGSQVACAGPHAASRQAAVGASEHPCLTANLPQALPAALPPLTEALQKVLEDLLADKAADPLLRDRMRHEYETDAQWSRMLEMNARMREIIEQFRPTQPARRDETRSRSLPNACTHHARIEALPQRLALL